MMTPFLDANFNTDLLNPMKSFDDFLQIAQVLEDASASLFKKTFPELHSLGITDIHYRILHMMHTVDARHAAYVRMIRAERGVTLAPWLSGPADSAVNDKMKYIYANEDKVQQSAIDVPSTTSVSLQSVKEAWDEPCDNKPINDLFRLFNVNYY